MGCWVAMPSTLSLYGTATSGHTLGLQLSSFRSTSASGLIRSQLFISGKSGGGDVLVF
jgi:hypothetical protein